LTAALIAFGLQSCNKEDNNGGNNGGDGGDATTLQWVDLGLPSGLLWADRNVGADKPEDYGNYYAWGETAPKEAYNWSTYAHGNDGYALTKYCSQSNYGLDGFTDNLTTLEASDDAATVNLGDGARTPTEVEWQELLDNTSGSWTTRNEVYGCLLTASNGKSLFLPAAGDRYDTILRSAGEDGYYWSSTMVWEYPNSGRASRFILEGQMTPGYGRFVGFTVRAVRANQN